MRLATILPENENKPVAAVSVDAQNWVALHPFLKFFGAPELPESPNAPLEQFLPILMPRFSELTRKISDWPEHGRLFQKDGGKTLKVRRTFPPILRPSTFRDFYAFEQHVRTARARRGEDMNPAWYEIPVFYFSNPNSFIGDNDNVFAPAGCTELDYELELGVVIGKRCRNITPAQAWSCVAGFTIINDFTARDLQRAEMPIGLGPAKGKDFATGVGPSAWVLVVGVAITHVPGISRIVRTATLEVSVRGYVEAAVARGERLTYILRREILPNIASPILADAGIRLTGSILLVASVNFLGLGLQPPAADWALMISENRGGLTIQAWASVVPIVLIAALTIAVNLVADAYARGLGQSTDRARIVR